MTTIYNWLVAQGLWHYVVGACVGLIFGLVIRPFFRSALYQVIALMHVNNDLLRTDTPDGLGQIKRDLDEQSQQLKELVEIHRGWHS